MPANINHPEINKEATKHITDKYIELFEVDLTRFDRGIFCFTTSYPEELGKVIKFNKREYTSLPINATGFEWSGQGQAPRPKLTLSVINPITAAMIITYQDLVFCQVKRIRTFEQFLDDGDTPNEAAIFQEDIFRIERKSNLSAYAAEFELASVVDQEGQYLPKNQVIKNYCSYVYRVSDNKGGFIYDKYNPCPYTGNNYFDKKNISTTADKDSCSKTLMGCQLRFTKAGILPFQGFPGVKRV